MLQDMGLGMDGIRDAAATATPTATAWFLIVSTGMTVSLMLDNGLSRFPPSSKVVGRQKARISDLPADQRVCVNMCMCGVHDSADVPHLYIHTILRASLATATATAPAHAAHADE
ncbi:hypothetical protein HYALB_00011034 [Hymenoscyphus albidus]|uniref:Uncharacterized protein n=1 Tax=Hymenoscyphus albidus TaxID=595503 RepID=A0A9N9Q442_9HELO|nr:hypothetical protein HYALB_00011034 [Hymenoscyphus albidus]